MFKDGTHNQRVGGSTPSGPTKKSRLQFVFDFFLLKPFKNPDDYAI